ncbi:MAG: hypothetical protein WB780_04150 [Candidatus Acidiferrales bacterium]
MKLFLALGALLLMALPASAQSAEFFVKGDGLHCYQDVAQVVHTHGRDVSESPDLHMIRVGHFSTPAGDMFLTVQALTEKNKKGEEGCRIYVEVEGGASLAPKSEVVNDLSNNTRIANSIGAEVAAMQKARDKK